MKHPIIINSRSKIFLRRRLRKNLPYQGIARRAMLEEVKYDKIIS